MSTSAWRLEPKARRGNATITVILSVSGVGWLLETASTKDKKRRGCAARAVETTVSFQPQTRLSFSAEQKRLILTIKLAAKQDREAGEGLIGVGGWEDAVLEPALLCSGLFFKSLSSLPPAFCAPSGKHSVLLLAFVAPWNLCPA